MNKNKYQATTKHILVVDDEHVMCDLLEFNLSNAGYSVESCYSAEEALRKDLTTFDLFIFDVMMGHMSGIALAEKIKSDPATAHTPIIFCSAKDNDDDVIAGLGVGADDYVKKPFSMRELVARVKSVLRRQDEFHPKQQSVNILKYEGLEINVDAHTVSADGEKLTLTRTEFEMLLLFMRNINRFFSRNEIFDHVWPEHVVVTDRTIDVNISRMRKKLGRYASNIVNRSGFGYGFVD